MTNNIIKFLTAGSVDDGKSTLIGKLLYDTNSIYHDQIDQIKELGNGEIDYSLFVEGLESERRQKITIDVAYRYFTYSDRKFIIADSPGHEQYTRNMAVAAANSDIAVILIDAKSGVRTQTIRHSYIAHLFGIKDFIIAVNKMDSVLYSQEIFAEIRKDYLHKSPFLSNANISFIPISATKSDNIIALSNKTNWYQDKSLLDLLLSVVVKPKNQNNTRILVQNVLKYNNERLYQAKLVSGSAVIGDKITVYPSKKTTIIKDIVKATDTNLSIMLEQEIDIDRGSIFAKEAINFTNKFKANLIWFSDKIYKREHYNSYAIKINHNYLDANIFQINHKVNIDHMSNMNKEQIEQNDVVNVDILLAQNTAFDQFSCSKYTGSFLLVDKNDNETLAVGLIN